MPIYKLKAQLEGGAKSSMRKDNRHQEHRQTFWELPESDRYRHRGEQWTEDADKRNIDSLPRVSSSLWLADFSVPTTQLNTGEVER